VAAWTDNQRMRADLGFPPDDTASLPDDQIDDAFARAGLRHADDATANTYAHVIVVEQLWAQAASSTDYTQNASSEKASQLFDHYSQMLDKWTKATADAINLSAAGEAGSVRSGRQTRIPARLKEFPGGGW
jgi:hypothetical protein